MSFNGYLGFDVDVDPDPSAITGPSQPNGAIDTWGWPNDCDPLIAEGPGHSYTGADFNGYPDFQFLGPTFTPTYLTDGISPGKGKWCRASSRHRSGAHYWTTGYRPQFHEGSAATSLSLKAPLPIPSLSHGGKFVLVVDGASLAHCRGQTNPSPLDHTSCPPPSPTHTTLPRPTGLVKGVS